MKEIIYEINENGISEIIDESKGSSFIALREIKWNKSDKYKLDLRKWYVNSEGKEVLGKGVTFPTEEGPHILTRVLLENGYGYSGDILMAIKNREDIPDTVKESIDNILLSEGSDKNMSYYDPGDLFKKGA